jgi:hypothetical protein
MKKNMLKGWIPTTGLVLAMAFSTFAKDGMLVSDLTGGSGNNRQCIEKVDSGIVINGFGGMLVSDFVGMLVSDLIKTSTCGEKVDNGIVINGFGGMLVSD